MEFSVYAGLYKPLSGDPENGLRIVVKVHGEDLTYEDVMPFTQDQLDFIERMKVRLEMEIEDAKR